MLCGENCHKELDSVLPGSSGMSLSSPGSAALLSELGWAGAGACLGIARLPRPALDWSTRPGAGRKDGMWTQVWAVCHCVRVLLWETDLGQQPLGTITPLNVLLYFLHSRYLLLLSWRTKWGNKTNCRTKIVWPAHKGKVAASHGWKNYSIKTAVRDGQFRTFGAVELRRKLMSERVCRSLSLH